MIQPRQTHTNLQQAVRSCRDPRAREKIRLFLRAQQTGKVTQACREFQKSPRFYYLWWNRFQAGGFKAEALQERSRRPKKTRQLHAEVGEWARHYREKFDDTLEQIQLKLLKNHQTRVSLATIHRILKKSKLPKRKKTPAPKGPSPANFSPNQFAAPSELGDIAGRYQLERKLGSGGGGVVYLARDQKHQHRPVALKRVKLKTANATRLGQALKNEFAALAALHHRHLAQVFDFGMTGRELYFTSEFIEGEEIFQATRKSNLNAVFQLIVQTLGGLDYLHGRGFLHLDLKPSNLLVTHPVATGESTVKIIDLGGAEWRNQGLAGRTAFLGTPPYSAPEVLQGGAASAASDIYSIGMILHQIFLGRFPLRGQNSIDMMKEQIYDQPLRIEEMPDALPSSFSEILHRCVAKDPASRFQSCRELLDAFNACLDENYVLREKTAPVQILDESNHCFHPQLVEDLVAALSLEKPQSIILSGAPQTGKTRLLQWVKERLQLQGIRAFHIQEPKALQDLLHGDPNAVSFPVLVDLPKLDIEALIPLLDDLENLQVPILLATEAKRHPSLNPHRWLVLNPLSSGQIAEYLQLEIGNCPVKTAAPEITSLSLGVSGEIEIVLEALRDEGYLQWSEGGWSWMDRGAVPWASLLSARENRWEKRLRDIQELLSLSPSGLAAHSLEGVLGMEAGSLTQRLSEWESLGLLTRKKSGGSALFIRAKSPSSSKQHAAPRGWPWASEKLEKLYEAGRFETGRELIDSVLSSEASPLEAPIRFRLWAARHRVAAGYPEQALALLPETLPDDAESRGLFHEIRARARFSLGSLPAAIEELTQAELYYGPEDCAGLSRVHNLRGSIEKKQDRPEQAETAFLQSIRFAQSLGESYHQGMAQMNLANLYQDLGRLSEAQQAYQQAFRLQRERENPLLTCKLLENWILFLLQAGRNADGEKACYDLLKTAIRHNYVEQQAAALNYLSILAGQQNHRQKKIQYLNQALGFLSEQQYPQKYFQCLLNRAYGHLEMEKFVPAQMDAEHALQIGQNGRNELFVAWANLVLGKIHRDRLRPDLEAAKIHFNKAHRWIWSKRYLRLLWEVEYDRGLLAKKMRETERAKNYLISAQTHLQAMADSMPQAYRSSYLRDRKLENIHEALKTLENEGKGEL